MGRYWLGLIPDRLRCVQGRWQRSSSRWWTEQMAASSASDTLTWVTTQYTTHTHTHTFLSHHRCCTDSAPLGKTYTMIGRDCSTQSLGVAPTAISWLFKVIEERREKSGARFSVRVSAVEISGREETLTDLLAELSSSSAGGHQEAPGQAVSLREDPLCGSQVEKKLLHSRPLKPSLCRLLPLFLLLLHPSIFKIKARTKVVAHSVYDSVW